MKSHSGKIEGKKTIILICAFALSLPLLYGQEQQKLTIKGQLKEQKTMQPVVFATVALRRVADSTLITGTASNIDGDFSVGSIPTGKYIIVISAIGYTGVSQNIELTDNYNVGTILLQEKSVALGDVIITSDRVKAKAEADKTTFFINEKIHDASSNGVDILSFIPGIQVDLMKNISLQGSQHIIIMVDGMERDRNYLSQLDADLIDKVEIISTPGSRYDANVTGVINIILRKDNVSGINGQIHAEVPVSSSAVYIFPDYNLNYSFKKLNLYTSYDGNLSYLDIVESSNRKIIDNHRTTEIISGQLLRQKDWSHRFHYGFDYLLNERNQINFYAFFNPYSNELNGNVAMQFMGENAINQNWSASKQDKDINLSSFYSVYYKHNFNKPGREIALDLTYFNFNAENSTTYSKTGISDNYLTNQVNIVKPLQNSASFKVDYSSLSSETLKFDAGIKAKSQLLQDRQAAGFNYKESIVALYGTFTFYFSKFILIAGMRGEKSTSEFKGSSYNDVFSLLPNALVNYKLTTKQIIKLSYSRTVHRPDIYELNPYVSIIDPFTVQSGNSGLKPEFNQNLSIEYSGNIGNSYISLQMFSKKSTDAINQYSFINDTSIIETTATNLGDIHKYGIQMTGALKINKAIALNPYLKLFSINTSGNELAKLYGIAARHKIAFETGLSAIVIFKYDIVSTLQFQYNSREMDIQGISFSDALYFITIEKSFNQRFKIGITGACLFSRSFTYKGNEIKGENFYSHTEGKVKLPAIPVWLKFTYKFNSGKKVNKIDRVREDIEKMPGKGF